MILKIFQTSHACMEIEMFSEFRDKQTSASSTLLAIISKIILIIVTVSVLEKSPTPVTMEQRGIMPIHVHHAN